MHDHSDCEARAEAAEKRAEHAERLLKRGKAHGVKTSRADMLVEIYGNPEELREKLAEYQNAVAGAMDEKCDLDEKHCTCVPLLRVKLREAELRERAAEQRESWWMEWYELGEKATRLGHAPPEIVARAKELRAALIEELF